MTRRWVRRFLVGLADLLDAAGVPTAPALTTLPAGLFLDLEWRSGLRPLPRE